MKIIDAYRQLLLGNVPAQFSPSEVWQARNQEVDTRGLLEERTWRPSIGGGAAHANEFTFSSAPRERRELGRRTWMGVAARETVHTRLEEALSPAVASLAKQKDAAHPRLAGRQLDAALNDTLFYLERAPGYHNVSQAAQRDLRGQAAAEVGRAALNADTQAIGVVHAFQEALEAPSAASFANALQACATLRAGREMEAGALGTVLDPPAPSSPDMPARAAADAKSAPSLKPTTQDLTKGPAVASYYKAAGRPLPSNVQALADDLDKLGLHSAATRWRNTPKGKAKAQNTFLAVQARRKQGSGDTGAVPVNQMPPQTPAQRAVAHVLWKEVPGLAALPEVLALTQVDRTTRDYLLKGNGRQRLRELGTEALSIPANAFAAGGSALAVQLAHGLAAQRAVRTGVGDISMRRLLSKSEDVAATLGLSPNGRHVLRVTSEGGLLLHDLSAATAPSSIPNLPLDAVTVPRFSADGAALVLTTATTLRLYRRDTQTWVDLQANAGDFLPDSAHFLALTHARSGTGVWETRIDTLDWRQNQRRHHGTESGHLACLSLAHRAPRGVVLDLQKDELVLFDTQSMRRLQSAAQPYFTTNLRFSPNDTLILCLPEQGTQVTLLDVNDLENRFTVDHEGYVHAAAFSPDSRVLASVTSQSLSLTDLDTGHPLMSVPSLMRLPRTVDMAFVPAQGTLRLLGHDDSVRDLHFVEDALSENDMR